MKVICFGDSNTYGYDPRSWLGGRYDADSRWVDILASETGWGVCNMGENGREIPTVAPKFPADTDLMIVMLGTNDLLHGRNPESAAEKLECVLSALTEHIKRKRAGRCHGDCANCPPHYGYRYGRWYYRKGHQYGCELGGNKGDGGF